MPAGCTNFTRKSKQSDHVTDYRTIQTALTCLSLDLRLTYFRVREAISLSTMWSSLCVCNTPPSYSLTPCGMLQTQSACEGVPQALLTWRLPVARCTPYLTPNVLTKWQGPLFLSKQPQGRHLSWKASTWSSWCSPEMSANQALKGVPAATVTPH